MAVVKHAVTLSKPFGVIPSIIAAIKAITQIIIKLNGTDAKPKIL